jgi:hypothetical protein
MAALVHQRCFHHSAREAAARCPECRHFYCRECITEHNDRVICSSCLKKLTAEPARRRMSFAWILPIFGFSVGLCLAWLFFYFLGSTLASIPSRYHEGTVWFGEDFEKLWKGK